MLMLKNLSFDNEPYVLSSLGEYCRITRIQSGFRQIDVANETGCSQQNVSFFERGENNNAILLLWYIKHGLLDVLKKWGEL